MVSRFNLTGLIFDDFLHLQFAPLQINNSDTLIQVMVKLARFSLIVHSKHSAIKTTAICFHSIELLFANLGPYRTHLILHTSQYNSRPFKRFCDWLTMAYHIFRAQSLIKGNFIITLLLQYMYTYIKVLTGYLK